MVKKFRRGNALYGFHGVAVMSVLLRTSSICLEQDPYEDMI